MDSGPRTSHKPKDTEAHEFEEADLFDGDDDNRSDGANGSPASDSEAGGLEDGGDAFPDCGMDVGQNSGSARSVTLNVVIEEDAAALASEAAVWTRPHNRTAMSCSVPAAAGIKMGSSVPMNIPIGKIGGRPVPAAPGGAFAAQPQYPATFVPPHELSQRDDFAFSLTGESPGVGIKRDKLRARNAILKSTGFLERNAGTGAVDSPTRQSLDRGNSQHFKGMVSGLSQALIATGSPR